MKNPCSKECPERGVGCHISCKRYKAYREYLDEKNAQIKQEECVIGYLHDKSEKINTLALRKQQKGRKADD